MFPDPDPDPKAVTVEDIQGKAPVVADPWDAPYFGAPVYFSYSSQVVPRLAPAPSLGSSNSSSGKQSLPAPVNAGITSATHVQSVAGASTARKRNWLARLFGPR